MNLEIVESDIPITVTLPDLADESYVWNFGILEGGKEVSVITPQGVFSILPGHQLTYSREKGIEITEL